MKHIHIWLPFENIAHYEEDKLHCTYLVSVICSDCGESKRITTSVDE